MGVASEQASTISRDYELEGLLHNWLWIWDLRLLVIAKVHGHCLTGGTQLAMICDVTFAAEGTRVGALQLPLGTGFVLGLAGYAKQAKKVFFPVGNMIYLGPRGSAERLVHPSIACRSTRSVCR